MISQSLLDALVASPKTSAYCLRRSRTERFSIFRTSLVTFSAIGWVSFLRVSEALTVTDSQLGIARRLAADLFRRFAQSTASVQSGQGDPEKFNNAALVLIGCVLVAGVFSLILGPVDLSTHLMDGVSVTGRIWFGVSLHR
ncbi:MAG: hypothetical protein AAFV88_21910 [Planctomycetota bacterium]